LLVNNHISDDPNGAALMQLVDKIRKDEFWKAQITELNIDGKGRIRIVPAVGDERIEFGYPENVDEKLKKLMIFYKEILPRVGWNKYDRVNLEFDGQI